MQNLINVVRILEPLHFTSDNDVANINDNVKKNLSLKAIVGGDNPTYQLLYKGRPYLEVSKPILASKSVFAIEQDGYYFSTYVCDMFRILVANYVNDKKIDASTGAQRLKFQNTKNTLSSNLKKFENLNIVSITEPNYVISKDMQYTSNATALVFGLGTKKIAFNKKVLLSYANPTLSVKSTDNIDVTMYELPTTNTVDMNVSDMIMKFVSNRFGFVKCISECLRFDHLPAEIDLSGLSKLETRIRANLFDLSKDRDNTMFRTADMYDSMPALLSLLKYKSAASVISGPIEGYKLDNKSVSIFEKMFKRQLQASDIDERYCSVSNLDYNELSNFYKVLLAILCRKLGTKAYSIDSLGINETYKITIDINLYISTMLRGFYYEQ